MDASTIVADLIIRAEDDASGALDAVAAQMEALAGVAESLNSSMAGMGGGVGGIEAEAGAFDSLAASADAAAAAADRANASVGGGGAAIGADAGAAGLDAQAAAADAAAAANADLAASADAAAGAEAALGGSADAAAAGLDTQAVSADAAAASSRGASSSMMGMLPPLSSLGPLALAAAAGFSIIKAAGFEDTMIHIGNNTAMTNGQLKQTTADVLKLGTAGPASLGDIATAFMRVSNVMGLVGNQAMPVVTAAWKAAIATGANLGDVTNALVTVMGNWHQPASQASADMGTIIEAMARGNMTLQDFVTNFSKIGVEASAIHMPLKDAASAFATISKATGSAPQAQTLLSGMITHMIAPTKAAVTEMGALKKATGVDLVAAFERFSKGQESFRNVMAQAKAATHGNAGELYSLFGGLRGGLGALILLDDHWKDYNKTIGQVAHSTSLLNSEFNRAKGTTSNLFGDLGNKLSIIGIGIGMMVLPEVNNLLKGLNQVGAWVIAHQADFRNFFNQLGSAAKAMMPDILNLKSALQQLGNAAAPLKPLLGPALFAGALAVITPFIALVDSAAAAMRVLAVSIMVVRTAFSALSSAASAVGSAVGHAFSSIGTTVHNALLGAAKQLSSFLTLASKVPMLGGLSHLGAAVAPLNNYIRSLQRVPPATQHVTTATQHMATQGTQHVQQFAQHAGKNFTQTANKANTAARHISTQVPQHIQQAATKSNTNAQKIATQVPNHIQQAATKSNTASQKIATQVPHNIQQAATKANAAMQKMSNQIPQLLTGMANKADTATQGMGDKVATQFTAMKGKATTAITAMASSVDSAMKSMTTRVNADATQMGTQVGTAMTQMGSKVNTAIATMTSQAIAKFAAFQAAAVASATATSAAYTTAMSAMSAQVNGIVSSMVATAGSIMQSLVGIAAAAGSAAGAAFAAGIASQVGAVAAAAQALQAAAAGSLKGHSPPPDAPWADFEQWGRTAGQLYAKGLRAQHEWVKAAAQDLNKAAEGAWFASMWKPSTIRHGPPVQHVHLHHVISEMPQARMHLEHAIGQVPGGIFRNLLGPELKDFAKQLTGFKNSYLDGMAHENNKYHHTVNKQNEEFHKKLAALEKKGGTSMEKNIEKLDKAHKNHVDKLWHAHEHHVVQLKREFANHVKALEAAMKAAATPHAIWDKLSTDLGTTFDNRVKALSLAFLEGHGHFLKLTESAAKALKAQDRMTAANEKAIIKIDLAAGHWSDALTAMTTQIDTKFTSAQDKFILDLLNHTGNLQKDAAALQKSYAAQERMAWATQLVANRLLDMSNGLQGLSQWSSQRFTANLFNLLGRIDKAGGNTSGIAMPTTHGVPGPTPPTPAQKTAQTTADKQLAATLRQEKEITNLKKEVTDLKHGQHADSVELRRITHTMATDTHQLRMMQQKYDPAMMAFMRHHGAHAGAERKRARTR